MSDFLSMPSCVFCQQGNLDLIAENALAFAIRDRFPVRRLHSLVLPKRHVDDTFDLTEAELVAIFDIARQVRTSIFMEDSSVGGFNFGTNNGAIAGQRIVHVHFHLIPRRPGEEEPPVAKENIG